MFCARITQLLHAEAEFACMHLVVALSLLGAKQKSFLQTNTFCHNYEAHACKESGLNWMVLKAFKSHIYWIIEDGSGYVEGKGCNDYKCSDR